MTTTWRENDVQPMTSLSFTRTAKQPSVYCLTQLPVLPLTAPAGTRLQLLDANHCPGAAMVVAYPPRGAPPVLHTGDARLTVEATQLQPALQALVGRAVLVLDTTYADPGYCFPPQQQVLDWVLRAVQVHAR